MGYILVGCLFIVLAWQINRRWNKAAQQPRGMTQAEIDEHCEKYHGSQNGPWQS